MIMSPMEFVETLQNYAPVEFAILTDTIADRVVGEEPVEMTCPRCKSKLPLKRMGWGFAADCERCWYAVMIQDGCVPEPVKKQWSEFLKTH